MSLTLTYNIARGALSTGAAQAAVVSRNIANVENPDASRKLARLGTDAIGTSYLQGIGSQIEKALHERATQSTSEINRLEAILEAFEQIGGLGDPDSVSSPAAQIGRFRDALQTASGAPHEPSALQGVLTSAASLVAALNDGAALNERVRTQADASIRSGVEALTGLLSDFAGANREIVAGTARGVDVTDQIDRRNGLLRSIAELVDVRAISGPNNDLTLTLANGVMLFETETRRIELDEGAGIAPGQPGAVLRIDGVPLSFRDRVGGRLGGLLTVRDDATLQFGRQLDEVARGLIMATAESDQSAIPSGPDLAGLFTYAAGPFLPTPGVAVDGLAAALRVNANADPAQGGQLERIRDGAISAPGNPGYGYNAAGVAGFSGRLLGLIDGLSSAISYDSATGVAATPSSVLEFATASAGWLELQRAEGHERVEVEQVRAERALGAWQAGVGVNLDNELSTLIALERSYQASTRLIGAVDGMFDALFAAVR